MEDEVFNEKPVNKMSLAKRSPVHGVGINDAEYRTVYKSSEGKTLQCPYYTRWQNMLTRCYSEKYHDMHPTYIGCTVSKDWLFFSKFKSWMITQDWQGKSLDKDILFQGNKKYSPETCVFVEQRVNNLLGSRAAARGKHPQGVYWVTRDQYFKAQINIDGKVKSLGCFKKSSEAEAVYKVAKAAEIYRIAQMQTDLRVKKALELRSNKLKENK